jgi:hypothetical protein
MTDTSQQPILSAIDALNAHMKHRHSWLRTASEQIRKWREEDARNGIEWLSQKEK